MENYENIQIYHQQFSPATMSGLKIKAKILIVSAIVHHDLH